MKILALIVLIFIGSFALFTSVYGEEILSPETERAERAPLRDDLLSIDNKTPTFGTEYEFNFLSLIFKTIFALGLITSVIYLIFRFFMKGRAFPFTSSSFIRVMGVAPLGPNKYVQLVEVANKILILGISGENINLLSEIHEKEVVDLIKTHASRESGKEKISFTHHLKTFFKGFSVTENYNKKIDFLKKQHERLKNL